MRRVVAVLLVLVVALVALGSIEQSGDGGDGTPSDPRVSPETLTEALMLLWQDRDRQTADLLGTDAALDALFGVTPPEAALEVAACADDPSLPDAKTCSARGGGQTVLVTVRKPAGERWWRAVAVLPIR